ncbi:hypothetical protein ACEPT7_13630 [Burkholderia ubonensis]|uniref:hypothetical protein n=1 Tax=Burkholderia ubonensis TaxID=101571 RepID=UPI0035900E7A
MGQKLPFRRPRSKAELLPLLAALVRDITLENHLELVTMRAGHGTPETMIALLRVLYLAFFIVEPTVAEGDLALFLQAFAGEQALKQPLRQHTKRNTGNNKTKRRANRADPLQELAMTDRLHRPERLDSLDVDRQIDARMREAIAILDVRNRAMLQAQERHRAAP